MIRLRTSYFTSPKVKEIVKQGKEKYLVSIARFSPFWFPEVKEELSLAPSKDLLYRYKKGLTSVTEYTKEYKTQIEPILGSIELKHGSVLLCYEKEGDFCHRHLLAELLREKGYEIEEL